MMSRIPSWAGMDVVYIGVFRGVAALSGFLGAALFPAATVYVIYIWCPHSITHYMCHIYHHAIYVTFLV
jgi:hypothetical protein